MRLGRSISAVAGTSAIAVAGLFLGLSPWLAGWRHGGSWSLATKTDFWSGLGLVVVSLAAMMLYRAGLTRDLAAAGIISRKPTLEETSEAPAPAERETAKDISDEALLNLAASVVRGISDSDGEGDDAKALVLPADAPVNEEELARLAASLLREIQGADTPAVAADAPSPTPETPLALMSEAELAQMAVSLLQEIQAGSETRPLVHSGEEVRHE